MKKFIYIAAMLFLVLALFSSCAFQRAADKPSEVQETLKKTDEVYSIGSKGPADGYVFYDCDADNNSGNADGLISSECGWRYLEACPVDLHGTYFWGTENNCRTENGIGTGRENTQKIIEDAKRKEEPTTAEEVLWGARVGAAAACDNYSVNGFSDWFLPSVEELLAMYENLKGVNKGGFANSGYWTSTENGARSAWSVSFKNGYKIDNMRHYNNHVRPVRSFM